MGIPVLLGRTFYPGEKKAVIVSESFAREQWPGINPVGQQMGDGPSKDTVVGVVGNARINALSDDITNSLTGGSLAGLIQIRDQEIPSIGTSLDQLAAGLANALNTANAQGTALNGYLGGDIFVPPPAGGVGAAATLTVNITNPALIAASSDGTPGSNGNLANLSAVANQDVANGQTPIDAYSTLVGQVGSATSNTSADADSSGLILQ